jgi:hypothetical protein
MFVITNMTKKPLMIDDVLVDPKEQLDVAVLSPAMLKAKKAGTLRVLSGDETPAERRADVAAIKSFHVGDPAIDG